MDNPEKMATLGNQDIGRRQTKTQHNTEHQKDEQHGPHKTPGMNPGGREGQAASGTHKTSAMLLI